MNEQILKYIRENLQNGASEAQIRQALFNSGWRQSDINEAFSAVHGKKRKSVNLWIPILVLLLVIGGGTAYVFLNVMSPAESSAKSSDENTFLNQEATSGCGTDMNCFIKASSSCQESDVTFTSNIDFFGMIVTTTNHYEIRGMQENRCILYIELEDQQFSFSEQARQSALASGMTEEDINFQLQEAKRGSELSIGKDGICKFKSNSELANLLAKLNAGTFSGETICTLTEQGSDCKSTGDWAVAECTGELFYPQLL